jgi:hypothetical protein
MRMGSLEGSSARMDEPELTDMRARYAEAQALLDAGRFDEATAEFVWLWQHIGEFEPSAVCVRVSIIASALDILAREHPPARERLVALRDELTPVIDSGAATSDELQDWAVLCRVVHQSERVLEWFDRMGPSYVPGPEHRWVMECCVIPQLKRRERWADAGRLYLEPLRILEGLHKMVTDIPSIAALHPEGASTIRASIEEGVLGDVGTMYASLRAAGRDVDAESVLKRARSFIPGELLERAVVDALTATARPSGQSRGRWELAS